MQVYEAKLTYTPTSNKVGSTRLTSSVEVYEYMKGIVDLHPHQEVFYVIPLTSNSRPMFRIAVTAGTATNSLAHPREVFKPAILASALSIICVHNHCSGDPAPSSADIHATRMLREAGRALCIPLEDHIIIGCQEDDSHRRGYYSFRDAGIL